MLACLLSAGRCVVLATVNCEGLHSMVVSVILVYWFFL